MRTMSYVKIAVACLGLGFTSPGTVVAYTDDTSVGDGRAPTGIELIAFEAPGCAYCPIFRRDVAPSYAGTPAGKVAPLRFVDLNNPAAKRFTLASPVTMVPTLVLVRDGVEIGRIAGYVGRENMHHILATMLPTE